MSRYSWAEDADGMPVYDMGHLGEWGRMVAQCEFLKRILTNSTAVRLFSLIRPAWGRNQTSCWIGQEELALRLAHNVKTIRDGERALEEVGVCRIVRRREGRKDVREIHWCDESGRDLLLEMMREAGADKIRPGERPAHGRATDPPVAGRVARHREKRERGDNQNPPTPQRGAFVVRGKAVSLNGHDCPAVREALGGWIESRKAIRKPPTARAVELVLKKADAWTDSKLVTALENSTAGSWQGVFDPDESKNGRDFQQRPTYNGRHDPHHVEDTRTADQMVDETMARLREQQERSLHTTTTTTPEF